MQTNMPTAMEAALRNAAPLRARQGGGHRSRRRRGRTRRLGAALAQAVRARIVPTHALQAHGATTGWLLALVLGLGFAHIARGQPGPQFADLRQRLMDEILIPSGIEDPRVLQAMRATPRHEFVTHDQRAKAYFDMSLPIGEGQTISSPFIVAFMTQALDPQPQDRVLEIGTGSGYQAAVLSPLVQDVFTIEIVESLGRRAGRTLRRLQYQNVQTKIGDGFLGWPEHAPFDKIIVTCSPENVPQPLVQQLREGGKMIIPVGRQYQQTLVEYTKVDGRLEQQVLRPTLFVPMTGTAEEMRTIRSDPSRPQLENGSFERVPETGQHLPGWFYQRQVERVRLASSPEGEHCARFFNGVPGRASLILQGLPLDGQTIPRVRVEAWVKLVGVVPGPDAEMRPMVSLDVYDRQRRSLGQQWLGPWTGTQDWTRVEATWRVPAQAQEAILRVGLFGASGEMYVDGLRIAPHGQPGSPAVIRTGP